MQCFSTVFGSWSPLVFSHNLRQTPLLLFFQCMRYYNHYDHHKMYFQKNTTNHHKIINTTGMLFLTFNFKRQLNFTNIFNATVATVWPASKLWLSVGQHWSLISSSTFVRFRAFVLMRIRGNKPLSQRYIVANEKSIRKKQFRQLWEWFTHSSPEPKKWHFMKNRPTTCWWIIPKITKLVLWFIENTGYSQRDRDRIS